MVDSGEGVWHPRGYAKRKMLGGVFRNTSFDPRSTEIASGTPYRFLPYCSRRVFLRRVIVLPLPGVVPSPTWLRGCLCSPCPLLLKVSEDSTFFPKMPSPFFKQLSQLSRRVFSPWKGHHIVQV